MKFLVRGDYIAREFIQKNRKKFNNFVNISTDNCSPNALWVDSFNGINPNQDFLFQFIDFREMTNTQAVKFRQQFTRNTMNAPKAVCLVIDPLVEMKYQLWKHKTENWRFWVQKQFIKDTQQFHNYFEQTQPQTLEEAFENAEIVINHLRQNNKDMPILFLPLSLSLHKELANKADFNNLGNLLAKKFDNFYIGKPLPQNLANYSLLSEEDEVNFISKINQLDFKINTDNDFYRKNNDLPLPKLKLDLKTHSHQCNESCLTLTKTFKANMQMYFEVTDTDFTRTQPIKFKPAIFQTHQENAPQNKEETAFYCKPFAWRMHIPDIYEINNSVNLSAVPTKSIEELGGFPPKKIPPVLPKCPNHWTYPWGVFRKQEGHKQGEITTDEQLLGYIFLRRLGDLAVYSQFQCHAEFEHENIMQQLHNEIVAWFQDKNNEIGQEVQSILFAGLYQGSENLQKWKADQKFESFQVEVMN